jgi:hypothetical protein
MEPAENAEVPGELPELQQEPPEPTKAEPVEPAEPKRGRGRPAGAKDTKPRKRKVTIVEEPIAKAPKVKAPPRVEEASPPEVVAPVPAVAPPEPPPEDSPRTLQHKAAEMLIRLHRSKYDVRRTNLAEIYSAGMMRM